MQEKEEEEEEIERGRRGAFFKGIINSLNALVLKAVVVHSAVMVDRVMQHGFSYNGWLTSQFYG